MELKLSKIQIQKLLEEYYKEQEDITGKVTISTTKGYCGYGMSEYIDCILDIKIKGKMELLGLEVPVEREISIEDLKSAISYFIEKTGHEVKSIHLDKGMSTKTTGYGMNERNVDTAYFEGVNVTIENKVKTIGGIK